MKHSLLFSFLLCSLFYANAQKIRFTDASNYWITRTTDLDGGPFQVVVNGGGYGIDTVFNGKTYKRLAKRVFIREDSVVGKVYVIGYASNDTVERVLYDYTLNVGDTITRTFTMTAHHIVTKIDSTKINAVWHKVWSFHFMYGPPPAWAGDYFVIEGIGSTKGPLYHMDPMSFEMTVDLLCFSNINGTNALQPPLYINNNLVFDNASTCLLDLANLPITTENVKIVPHPANGSSNIVLPYKMQNGELSVYNVYGQLIFKEHILQKERIPLNNIDKPGTYIYRVTDISGNHNYIGRFTYQQ